MKSLALTELTDQVGQIVNSFNPDKPFPARSPFAQSLVHTIVLAPRLEFAKAEVRRMCTFSVFIRYGVTWNADTEAMVEGLYVILSKVRNQCYSD